MDTQKCENHNNTMIYFGSLVGEADFSEIVVKGNIMVDKIENKPGFSKKK